MADHVWGFRTCALHAGARPDPHTGARAVPIYQSTSFVFEDTQDAADLFALQKFGTIYTRISNPTIAAFEERVASLEGGIGGVACASGQAAEYLAMTALAGSGDNIVANFLALWGHGDTVRRHTSPIGNRHTLRQHERCGRGPFGHRRQHEGGLHRDHRQPVGRGRRPRIALDGHERLPEFPLVVDNTFATPFLCRPIEWGADIVVQSATKFLGGHGTSIGGVVVDSGHFDWGNGRFPMMTDPIPSYNGLQWWDNFGEYAFATKLA